MKYIKINSLYKREGAVAAEESARLKTHVVANNKMRLIEGHYACPEFAIISSWRVDEKVDGTNIRIMFDGESMRFGGRTDAANIPAHLVDYLTTHFTVERLSAAIPDMRPEIPVTLFGEGYGHKIQAAGPDYRKDVGFILFDIVIGPWWLAKDTVREIADKLEVPAVPDLGIMTTQEVVDFVKSKPLSRCSCNPQMMEGVICRPEPLMLFRNGLPVIWKLKCRDF